MAEGGVEQVSSRRKWGASWPSGAISAVVASDLLTAPRLCPKVDAVHGVNPSTCERDIISATADKHEQPPRRRPAEGHDRRRTRRARGADGDDRGGARRASPRPAASAKAGAIHEVKRFAAENLPKEKLLGATNKWQVVAVAVQNGLSLEPLLAEFGPPPNEAESRARTSRGGGAASDDDEPPPPPPPAAALAALAVQGVGGERSTRPTTTWRWCASERRRRTGRHALIA